MTTTDDKRLTFDDTARCPECNLVLSLSIYYKTINPYINYHCENNHKGDISLDDYLRKYNSFSLSKEKCSECNTFQSGANGDFSFCSKCNKFICHSCIINHRNNDGHNTTDINRYDALCKLHSNYYGFYCNNCKKNLCMYCRNEHQSHDIVDLIQYKNSCESTKNLEEKMKNIEKQKNILEEIKKKINGEIEKFQKIYESEIKYFNLLLNTFKYEESRNNINYNVIENIKNYEETFQHYKMKMLDNIIEESNKLISLFQTIGLQKYYKNLKHHNGWVYYLLKLKDGRLASCSYDKKLNIYKKDTFELQLSISHHSGRIYYIAQLRNDNILTCSEDKTMNIIKLINENNYILEQKLIGHSNLVLRAIEIRDNKLISISCDNTMKVWNLNNNNKYECTNTINFQNSNATCSILQLNENEFVTCSSGDKCLKFWNSNNFANISTINNIQLNWREPLCKLDDDILCGGGMRGFYLIKISTHQLIKNIMNSIQIFSLSKCLNGFFLCHIFENGHYSLVKYKYKNLNMCKEIEKENPYSGSDSNFIEFNNDFIISSQYQDYDIIIWKI